MEVALVELARTMSNQQQIVRLAVVAAAADVRAEVAVEPDPSVVVI